MADYRGYVTAAGQTFEALAKQMGYPVTIGFIEVGDGKLPDSESPLARTQLVHKLKQFPAIVEQDSKNPGQWVATCYIPADDAINGAGYFIREIGCKLINQGDGVLYAYRRVSDDWKPVITSGEAKSFIYRLRFIPSNGELLTPTIDPSLVLVDKEELERSILAHERSRNHPYASDTEHGFSRHATAEELDKQKTKADNPQPVVTVENLWLWANELSGEVNHVFSLWKRLAAQFGYELIGVFGDSCIIESSNQVLLSKDGTSLYSWTGQLPKEVTNSSTIENSGGIGLGAWKPNSGAYGITTTENIATGLYMEGSVVVILDRGHAIARIIPGSDANGETILQAGNGLVAVIDKEYYDKAETYSSLKSAFIYAQQLGIKVLRVDSDLVSVEDIPYKGAVSLIGNGSVSGVYRKRVARDTDPVSASFNDINPESHLKRFISNPNPVVVFVGDSIATETGANIPASDTLYHRLKARIAAAYPDKKISFHNRSIGGETYFSAVGHPSNFPAWYTDRSFGWPWYVGVLSPDLIIFNFGMNDGSNLHTNKIDDYQRLLDDRSLFPAGRPDVIYCTNLTPSIDTTFANLGSKKAQDGRDLVAGYTRTYAKSVGAGLLDFHRQCTIIKDGFDPTDTYLEFVGGIDPVNGAVSAIDHPCTDFKMELTLTIPSGNNMAVRLGAPSDPVIDPERRGSYAVIYNSEGFAKVDFFTADVESKNRIYASFETSIQIPTGAFVLSVEKRQSSCLISIDGVSVVSFDKLRVAGADVAPMAGNATYTSGNITKANLWVGRYRTYKQSITNDDMWGNSDNAAVQRYPIGGNGANHPSSMGSLAVFQPVIDNANFSGVGEYVANLTLVNGWRPVPGKIPSRAHRSGNLVTITFSMQVPVSGTAAKGVFANVPDAFRPPSGLSVYGIIQTSNAATSNVQCDLSSNGDIRIYSNVDSFAWGTISFVI